MTTAPVTEREPELYIRVTQEWAHAVTIFGRCNGTDWSVLMTIAHFTWGMSRSSHEIGMSIFQSRLGQKLETIRQSVAKLSTPSPGGFGMVRIVHEQTVKRSRVLSLEDNWMLWTWESEDHLARCSLAMGVYKKRSRSTISDWEPDRRAVELATELREHCIGIIPQAEVPSLDLNDPRWRRWVQSMERMLVKRSPELLGAMMRFVHRDTFFRGLVLGEAADLRLERNVDTIHQRMKAQATRR